MSKTRKLTKFSTNPTRGGKPETVEIEGYPLARGLVLSKLIKSDTDGDIRYRPTWAIYDQRTGALYSLTSIGQELLEVTA